MQTIRAVGVLSAAKMLGAIYGALGLIFAPIFLLIGMAGMMAGGREAVFGGVTGVVFAVLLPVLYGAMGFVIGAIGALLYNLFARWVGGIEVQLQPPLIAQAGMVQPMV
jgi:hypothetical protein